MKKLNFYLFLGIILVSSCKKKSSDDTSPTNAQSTTPAIVLDSSSAKSSMRSTKTDLVNDVVALTKGTGTTQLTNMMDVVLAVSPTEPISLNRLASGEGLDTKEMSNLLGKQAKLFLKMFAPKSVITSLNRTQSTQGYYGFDNNVGTYTWDSTSQNWTKTSNIDQDIVIKFPSDSTKQNVNDAVFTLTNLAVQYTTEQDGTKDTLPTSIIANLTVKGTTVASINYTAAYTSEGIPTALNGSVFLAPFTYTANFTDNGSSVSGTSTLLNGTSVIVSINSTVYLTGTGDNRLPTSVSGYVQYRSVKLTGTVSGLDNQNENDTTVAQVNTHLNLDLVRSSDNAHIAHVDIAERAGSGNNTIQYVRLNYSDGTNEDILTYLQPAFDEMENFLQSQSK